jgi:hypothetical protein
VRKDELAEPVVDIWSAGVVEAHVEFDEEAHEEVEVEIGHESVRVDVADAACVVGNVENKLWELCRSGQGAAMGERDGCLEIILVEGEYLPTSASTPTSIYLAAVHRLRP